MMKRRSSEAGMTLIEMMIAIVLSMVLSIAVMAVMSTFENRRRTLGSASDLDQQGNLAMFQMDRWIRSAGTGLVQGNSYTYGCQLFAASGNQQALPISTGFPLPAPFGSVAEAGSGVFRLAPVMILPGQTTPGVSGATSDVLVVMASGNDGSQVPTPVTAPPTASALAVANTTEFAPNDVVLVADKQLAAGGGPNPCMVSQVSSTLVTGGVGQALPLAGTLYESTIGTRSLTSYTDSAVAIDLGGNGSSSSTSVLPTFQLVGVGDNNTLYSYDLLQVAATPLQAQAEGVFEMHALYGVDSTGSSNNVVNQWVDASTSSYTVSALTAGTAAAGALIKNIRAVHVALIMRSALPEKNAVVAGTSLSYFTGVPGFTAVSRSLSSTEQHYRYRVIETTIPVRNNNYQ